jgi:hypothetical protein
MLNIKLSTLLAFTLVAIAIAGPIPTPGAGAAVDKVSSRKYFWKSVVDIISKVNPDVLFAGHDWIVAARADKVSSGKRFDIQLTLVEGQS